MTLNVVVFPAPLGPRSAKIVSWDTPKLTLSTTRFVALSNALTTFITLSASSDAVTFAASSSTSFISAFSPKDLEPEVGFFLRNCENLRTMIDPESTQTRMSNSTNA